jgi:hypothetical protein
MMHHACALHCAAICCPVYAYRPLRGALRRYLGCLQRSVYILPDLPEEQKRSRGWQQAPAGVPETVPQSADEPAWRYNSAAKGTARRRTSQLVVFSRDAAEQLWLEQHLSGGGESNGGQADPEQQREVTTLALDLLLLALMCSGDDYLPAVQVRRSGRTALPSVWAAASSWLHVQSCCQALCLVSGGQRLPHLIALPF